MATASGGSGTDGVRVPWIALLASAAAPVLGAFLLSQGGAVLLVAITTALAMAALALAARLPRGAV